jgi:hypothetical protein
MLGEPSEKWISVVVKFKDQCCTCQKVLEKGSTAYYLKGFLQCSKCCPVGDRGYE